VRKLAGKSGPRSVRRERRLSGPIINNHRARETVASKYECRCGEIVRTNLSEGHQVHLLVSERLLELSDSQLAEGIDSLLDRISLESSVVAVCRKCGRLAVIDKYYNVKLYEPAPAR
jgi:hypothetical protein